MKPSACESTGASAGVGTASIKSALGQYNVLHYAGHADYDLQAPA